MKKTNLVLSAAIVCLAFTVVSFINVSAEPPPGKGNNKKFNSIDILVNNAGFAIYGSVTNLSIDDIESQHPVVIKKQPVSGAFALAHGLLREGASLVAV